MAAAAGGGGQPGPGMASNRLSTSLVGNEALAASTAAAQSPKLARSRGGSKSGGEDVLAREQRASDWRLKQLRKVRSVELGGLPEPTYEGPATAKGDAACFLLLPAHDPTTTEPGRESG